jgi:hypothetical protein
VSAPIVIFIKERNFDETEKLITERSRPQQKIGSGLLMKKVGHAQLAENPC